MTEHTGSCLCGAVRYRFEGEPRAVTLCHCRHCQRLSGGSFTHNLVIREQDYTQEGDTHVFEDSGDSGNPVLRSFCPTCGAHILAKIAAAPGKLVLKGGTLDHPEHFPPTVEIYTARACDWLPPVQGTKRLAEGA